MMRVRWANCVLLVVLLLPLVAGYPVAGTLADATPVYYAGWAVEAYPELSAVEMQDIIRRMASAGANLVWIGHNNPGIVDPQKVEPGLSYAVYEAYRNPTDTRHQAAAAVIEAQHRMLAACRAAGVKAVLPVGYQIQMGRVWNENHPRDLRLYAEGEPLDIYGGGVSASFYAPSYRRAIEEYYRWVDAEFVQPYADVLLMLNLADEPIGGDYSRHAEAEFQRRHGFDFGGVGEDPHRQRLLGEFQSHYVVEYAIYSAELWLEIHPGLPVTMSFDGAQARQTFTMPDVEALFRDTPSNFVVTFDAYPRDGLPDKPLSDQDLVGLFLLARSVGLYSARYGKPVWLWAAANSWGLSQASADPGTVSDAVTNGLYLALLVRESGGTLQGIAYWNYNVKEQGLYNDTHDTAYDPETMFVQVSAALPILRRLMASPPSYPEVLLLAPPARSYEQIGAERAAVKLEVQPFRRLAILTKANVNAAVVDSLAGSTSFAADGWLDGEAGAAIRVVVALSPSVDHFSDDDLAILREFLGRGGKVVTAPGVASALAGAGGAAPELLYDGLVEKRGNLYIAQQGIAVLFEDQRHEVLSGLWQELLGLDIPQPGYCVVTDRVAVYYHLGPEPATVHLELPYGAIGYRYDDQARPVELLHGSRLVFTLGRREYVMLFRDWWPHPWLV